MAAKEASLQDDCAMSHYLKASDNQLLLAAKAGVQQAFTELCRRHASAAKKRILRILQNQHDAEDALQETLLRAYTHLDGFRGHCSFSTWLRSIGTNSAFMVLRKRRARKETNFDLADDGTVSFVAQEYADSAPDPEQQYGRHQNILLVRQEVEKLRPRFRSLVNKYYGTECSLKEAADSLGISVNAAKSRLLRGRLTLRSSLWRHKVFNSGT